MDFQMYDCSENTEIVINNFSPVEDSMEDEEYFDWTNSLKIDEKFEGNKNGRKRKLNGNPSSEVSKIRANGLKILKTNTENNVDAAKLHNNKKSEAQNDGNSRMPQWQVDDITDLNADIEGSLNGLGSELSNNSYNMSDAILSISGLTVFKQEAPSPPISQDVNAIQMARQNHSIPVTTQTTVVTQNNTISDSNANVINNTLHQLLGQTGYSNLQNAIDSNLIPSSPTLSQDGFGVVSSASSIEDCRFQYVLAAATSIATKVNEDTLTYLNQGQSYEIKLKKLGDLSTYKGKLLKSVIRICFHERRLQYMEKEQMTLWQKSRPGDRILEVDVPLSYGLCDVSQPTNALNTVYFSWDPTKEVGVYIKVNCISTEFTPKKHGGEKGVPFRIQVETYQADDANDPPKRLHAAVCQIKVFKLKGADRKHKQDREKIMKRPPSEQEKYQPSYECTVLSDIPCDAVVSPPPVGTFTPTSAPQNNSPPLQAQPVPKVEVSIISKPTSVANSTIIDSRPAPPETQKLLSDILSVASDPKQTVCWLVNNRFEKYLSTFSSFSGADMLRMSKDDFIQICGQADGIRLYNAVHLKAIAPKLTIYVCRDNKNVYNAIFLSAHSNVELLQKLSELIGIPKEHVRDIYMQGPHSIHIHLNNDVISHIKEETMFNLEILQENGRYILLLKPASK